MRHPNPVDIALDLNWKGQEAIFPTQKALLLKYSLVTSVFSLNGLGFSHLTQ